MFYWNEQVLFVRVIYGLSAELPGLRGPVFVGGLDVGLRLLDLNIALSLALSASRGVPTTSEDFFISPSAVAALYFFGHLITS